MRTFLLIAIALLTTSCTNLFFFPSKRSFVEKEALKRPVKDIHFKSFDGTPLHGWLINRDEGAESKGLVVHFHGNAQNLTTHFTGVLWMAKYGYDIFVFDYRGYGKSEGHPYPQGTGQDALKALNMAVEFVDNRPKSIVAYGQSLGGAIMLSALADFKHVDTLKAVIVESTFWSYRQIAREKLARTVLTWPLQWLGYVLVSDQFGVINTLSRLPDVPFMLIHGDNDPVTPMHHGEEIFVHAKAPKCFWRVAGAGHTQAMHIDKGKRREQLIQYLDDFNCDAIPDAQSDWRKPDWQVPKHVLSGKQW